jgi:penicillin-binding protein 1A
MSLINQIFDKKYNKYIKWLWIFAFSGIFILSLLITILWKDWVPTSYKLPPLEELENPKTLLASEVYSSDGVLMGKYFLQNRSNANFEELSPQLLNALIATEDIRFYEHSGIDNNRLFTIIAYNLIGRRQGGSTITQQLAKNLFPRKRFKHIHQKVITKLQEWITAIRIEQRYTKQEILTMYFNTVEFGGNAFGIRSASKVFFGKTPKELNAPEAALLVGMLKGITKFNPNRNPASALNRRNTVLNQMLKNGYLTEKEALKFKNEAIKLNYQEDDHNEGLATYFREHLRVELMEWAEENGFNLYKDGLKIYTTINAKMQAQAELAVDEHLATMQKKFYAHWKGREPWGSHKELLEMAMKRSDRYKLCKEQNLSQEEIDRQFNAIVKMKVYSSARGEIDTMMTPLDSLKYYKYFMQCGMMSMDPRTGQVKAWVGGNNYKYFKYDHVNQNSKRQVGSTFKPFVYTLAVDNGVSPCTIFPNKPVQFEGYPDYKPGNADEQYTTGDMTMFRGLQFSVNLIALNVLKSLGSDAIKQVINIAKKMGVESPMGPYPATALGTADISVFEMTGAFSTFANKGVWIKPNYLLKITDKNGNIIYEPKVESREALNEQTSYVMCKMLEKVTAHGTAAKVKYQYGVQGAVGGKTGTTQNYSDGWFIGITPTLTTGIWTGFEDRAIHFRSMDLGSGSAMAMPIFGNYMKAVQAQKLAEIVPYWSEPKSELTLELDCDKFKPETKSNNNDFMEE